MKSTTKLALVAAAGVAAYVAFRSLGAPAPLAEDPALLTGRVWLETKPEKPTDYVHGAYILPRPRIGLFHRASAYDFHFERFDYDRDGSKLSMTFPQSGKKVDVAFTITKCDSLPPFDLCLDLAENPWGGPKRYYGMERQDDEALGKLGAEIRAEAEAP